MRSGANKPTLLIGYGNPLREDDGLGVAVADTLRDQPGLDILTAHQLLIEMAETIARYRRVIFVDVNATVPPGVLAVPLMQPDQAALGHTLSPWRVMACARELFGAQTECVIFSAGGAGFGYKETLSPTAQRAVNQLSDMIKKMVD